MEHYKNHKKHSNNCCSGHKKHSNSCH
jgi:hypothetical protein